MNGERQVRANCRSEGRGATVEGRARFDGSGGGAEEGRACRGKEGVSCAFGSVNLEEGECGNENGTHESGRRWRRNSTSPFDRFARS